MALKNLKIGTQLKLGFGLMLLFVVLLGVTAIFETGQLHQQTEIMYQHPVKTRRALEAVSTGILSMQVSIRDFLLADNDGARQKILAERDAHESTILLEIENLRQAYLGPKADIDAFFRDYSKLSFIYDGTVRLLSTGSVAEARLRHLPGGAGPTQVLLIQSDLEKIRDFATKKGDSLYDASNKLNDSLSRQLITLVAAILLVSLVINYILLRNIREPLEALTAAARRFHEGDLDSRCSYASDNEFGIMSASFNNLAEGIQLNWTLDKKVVYLAGLMLSEYDTKNFFKTTLNALAENTGSQMAAIYLLSADRRTFEHFESIGMDNSARQAFSANCFEGEIGSAMASRKIQHVRNIAGDTRFVFHTTFGKFIPHEIVVLPILADNEVIAVISLATVSSYDRQALRLIDNIHLTLCARVEGVMAYHKLKDFAERLTEQNRELDAQKTELAAQSAELITQNDVLEIQKKQLDEASRLKTNFLSNMSHELRTPLNSVIALSGVLNRRLAGQIPAEEQSYLEVIERNGKNLLLLINDILDIARIEAGREEVEITEFNANSLVAVVADMIRPLALQKKIELLHEDSQTVHAITSDAGKCRHILQNLLGNAVKFTEKGQVEVYVRQTATQIEITVADTGIGIDVSHLPHIFDEFRQADSSTSRKFGGTGLGLTIAQKYANLLGGRIIVESTPGKGSLFKLCLPLTYSAENDTARPVTAASQQPDRLAPPESLTAAVTKTILLVDDSAPALVQLQDILAESGYRILVAKDGAEALAIIAQTIPDAMVLDLMMAGMDGFEVLQTIRNTERTAHIPVLILSAKHITRDELLFLRHNNIHQLIQKGDVNRSELQQAVASMVSVAPVAEVKPQRERQSIAGKATVLIVEDNPDNMLTAKALLANDYAVLEAADGEAAIEMASAHKPDLILMDIALPGMDGITAFKCIRNDPHLQHIPVIALTASAMTSDRETILAYGFDAYIAKPIIAQEFFNSINEALYGD